MKEEFNFPEAELVKQTEIFRNCKNVVVGEGNVHADILFVGEAPGRKEDEQGLPFVGAAGKNLDKLLAKVGLDRKKDIYIANILKCRPPENRNPSDEEISLHTPWLLKQIKEINPKVVCSLGNYATKFFLAGCTVEGMKKQKGITELHGKIQFIEICNSSNTQKGCENIQTESLKVKLIPLFHPAAIIYNRGLIPLWEEDMLIVKSEIFAPDFTSVRI